MQALKSSPLLLATALALAVLPAAASGQYLVPPDNSAATQYTESIPVPGGQRDVERKAGGNHDQRRSTDAVLGKRAAEQLRGHGPAGEAVAELVVETGLVADPSPSSSEANEGQQDDGDRGSGGATPALPPSGGSSGLAEVLGHAAGLSASGGMGLILPLVLFGTIVWALIFLQRRRNQPSA